MKIYSFFLLLSFFSAFLFAQSADFVSELIASKRATFGHACYIFSVYQNIIDENESQPTAVNALFEQGLLPQKADENVPISYEQLARLFCTMWNVEGGLLYRASKKSPRYALRQLKRDGVIDKNIDPNSIPTGRELLNIFTLGEIKYNDRGTE